MVCGAENSESGTYSRVAAVTAKDDGVSTKANVKVVVRVRPENQYERSGNHGRSVQVLDDHVLVFDPKQAGSPDFYQGRKRRGRDVTKRKHKDVRFAFDQVFDESTSNIQVYNNTTKLILDGLLDGYNCSVFAYGATGAGKTFTMLGSTSQPGVIFYTMLDLYKSIDNAKNDKTCEVAVSYLEVYNEQIRDLLMPGAYLPIREDPVRGAVVAGLSLHKPTTAEELMHMLEFGNQNRTQHPTDANKESSRSHAVFQVFVRKKDRTANISADVRIAKMSLIDLAGSERATVTTNRGARFREGANINRSLLALGNCINALAEGKQKGYIPYRNSKLTRLLKDSLGGNCRTVMIAAVSPSNMTYEDTHNTLKYANRAKNIKADLKRNTVSVDFHVTKYAKICEDLRVEVSELRLKLKQYEEGTVLRAATNPALPPVKQMELEQLQGEVYRVYTDKSSIHKELMEMEGAERDLLYRIHGRQRTLARITTLYTSPDDRHLIAKRESAINAMIKRQGNIGSRKEKLLHSLGENTEWEKKVESSVEQFTKNCSSPDAKGLKSTMKIQQLEIEVRNARRQLRVTRKICRAQEREAKNSDKLLTTLLSMVKQQFLLLKANGLSTAEDISAYDEMKISLTGDKVMWADQSVCPDATMVDNAREGDQFDINRLLEFHPVLNGCGTPKTPRNKQLVQILGTPTQTTNKLTTLTNQPSAILTPIPNKNIYSNAGPEDDLHLSTALVSGTKSPNHPAAITLDIPAVAKAHSTPLPAKHHSPGTVQFGSETITIDPGISVLINGACQTSAPPVQDKPVTSLSVSVSQAGSCEPVTEPSTAIGNDTFTMDGVFPLQLSPSDAKPSLSQQETSKPGLQQSHCESIAENTLNSPIKPRLEVNTATVTKTKPTVISKEYQDTRSNYSRVINFDQVNSPVGGKSFADAVKSPAAALISREATFSSRSPLASRDNLPDFTPTGSNFNKQFTQVDPRRMTFAGDNGAKQKLFKGEIHVKGQGGPIRRQTITATETRRMKTLHNLGLPSVAERKLGEAGRRAMHPKTSITRTKSGSVPGYMQTTFSRRQHGHHRSMSSEGQNDENKKPGQGFRRVPVDENKPKRMKQVMRSKSTASLYQNKRPAFGHV